MDAQNAALEVRSVANHEQPLDHQSNWPVYGGCKHPCFLVIVIVRVIITAAVVIVEIIAVTEIVK